MTDHYELFGVEPDATKDEIKSAYRSEVESADSSRSCGAQSRVERPLGPDPAAALRRVAREWRRGSGRPPGESEESDESTVPARRATGARRGPKSTVLKADGSGSNGSGKNGSGNGRGGGSGGGGSDNPDDRPLGRPAPEPTVVLPNGMHLAAKKRQRGFSILFDLSILAVLYVLFVSVLIPMVLKDQYPTEVGRLDAISKQLDKLDDQKSKAEDTESKFNDQASAARDKGDDAAADEAEASVDSAKQIVNAREKDIEKLEDETSDLQGKLIGNDVPDAGCVARRVPAVPRPDAGPHRADARQAAAAASGSYAPTAARPASAAVLAHSAVPVVIALAIPQLGPIVALAIVFWSLRDRNGQGVHDKLAKTLVVDSPPNT